VLTALFACAVGITFFAFVQLTPRKKQSTHYLMIVSSVAAAAVLLYFWAVGTGLVARVPFLVNADIVVIFLVAPAFYLASLTILHEGRRPVRSYVVYFAVPLLLAAGFEVYNALTTIPSVRQSGSVPGHFADPVVTLAALTACLTYTTAIVLDLVAAYRLRRAGGVHDPEGFRHQLVFLWIYLGACFPVLSSFIFRDDRILRASVLVMGCIVVAFAISRSYAVYFSAGHDGTRRKSARPEWDSSAQQLSTRLTDLMASSAPYRDADLTARRLAHVLGEQSRRLSYHFAVHLSTTFRSYINEWRLKSVCKDLLKSPERSILDIALENGFNSKSSFNTLFFQKYGKTPRQFKKENLKRA